MKFYTVSDAVKLGLIQLTIWSMNTPEERLSLKKSRDQIMQNKLRKTMFVQGSDFRIALFVDNIAKSGGDLKDTRVRQISKSGKYQSLRHLAETLFAKNPDLSLAKWKYEVGKEYPKSESAGMKCYGHFCWYRHHLVMQGRFRYIERPSWFKARVS